MPRTRKELIDYIMASNASFILGNGAGVQANVAIRELLHKALLDEELFTQTWKKFLRDDG